jgi:hypothetical protein
MKNLKIIICIAVLLLVTAHVQAMGKKEPGQVKVTVSGTVRLVGSSPMPSLVITGEDREWYIEQAEEKKLFHLQQQNVTVSATEYYADYTFANGVTAGRRYFLKKITVIGTIGTN